jgi:hypothetical protein
VHDAEVVAATAHGAASAASAALDIARLRLREQQDAERMAAATDGALVGLGNAEEKDFPGQIITIKVH